jgi:hypothetical protein
LFVSQSVTGTVSIGNTIPTHGVTFVSQSVTGTVSVGNIVAVSQSTVPASAIWITGTVATVGGGSAVTFVSQSVTGTVSVGNVVTVTSSVTNPIQITGTIHYDNASSGGGTQYGTGSIVAYTGTLALYAQESDNSAVAAKTDTNHVLLVNMVSGTIPAASNPTVAGTGSAAPFSASLVGLKDDAGNIRPLSGSSNGVLYVAISGAIDAVFSGTQIVTSTVAAPVWITGTSHFDNTSIATTFVSQSVTGTVSVGNVVSVTATVANPVQITGTTHFDNTSIAVTFVSQSITGTVSIGNTHPVTFISQSVTGTISIGNVIPTHGVTFISQSVTGAISITNTPAVTFVSQSVTGTISIGNVIATHGVTFVSQSVTGTVSIGNTAAVTSTFANPVWVITRPQIVTTPTIAVVTASSTSQQLFAANANRIGVTIQNFAASNAIFVNLNTSEARFNSATVRIAGNGYWEMPFRYTGSIQIAASGAQTAIAIGQEFFG